MSRRRSRAPRPRQPRSRTTVGPGRIRPGPITSDPGIDRDRYFERCWPNSETTAAFEYVRLAEVGDEVLVTYEATRSDGTKFRNTEIFGFAGELIARTEVYFGWNL